MTQKNHTQNIRRSLKLSVLGVGVISALWLAGCLKTPIGTERTDNQEIPVSLLFEKDGVKVYRFMDGGRAVYYTDARGRTEWVDGGKHKTHHAVETVR